MRVSPGRFGQILLSFNGQEVSVLSHLVGQLAALLQSHSSVPLDPDPLFARLEIGGTDERPDDPVLARLLPDAYDSSDSASEFRRTTEQGLINRKIEDAMLVWAALSLDSPDSIHQPSSSPVTVTITERTFLPWLSTLNAVRLALGVRLGIVEESDHERVSADEDAAPTVAIFQWLAGLIEALIQLEGTLTETAE